MLTEFNVPGAGMGASQGTLPEVFNSLDVVGGPYIDSNNVYHGFMRYPNGTIATFDAPGAGTGAGQGTFADCLNDEGVIGGMYFDANGAVHGFLRTPW
jgi:hypothetical protein